MYEKRIELGAAWLDEVKPGWVDLVDLEKLYLGSCTRCVLGQLFAENEKDLNGFDMGHIILGGWDSAVEEHGFDVPVIHQNDEYETLTSEWKSYISSRRENVKT